MIEKLTAHQIAKKLGAAQRRGVKALRGDGAWGPSGEYDAMVRLWYRRDIPLLIDHKHKTGDCWALRPIGLAVQDLLRGDHHP